MKRRLKKALYVGLSRFATRVKAGPLEGCRWTLFSGIRFVRGDFEPKKTAAVVANLHPGDVFWDIGGNVGYFTVIASKAVGDTGKVVTLEPSPVNLAFLRRNLKLNRCGNVDLLPMAAGPKLDRLRLDTSTGRGTHHITEGGDTVVAVDSVDGLIAKGKPAPNFIKIDVEGFEESVLDGMTDTLTKLKPLLLLAVHSPEIEARTKERLASFGYSLSERLSESKGDEELLYAPDSRS